MSIFHSGEGVVDHGRDLFLQRSSAELLKNKQKSIDVKSEVKAGIQR
jgi:hypothetical protein